MTWWCRPVSEYQLLVILVSLATSGCNTPQSICTDMVTTLDELLVPCGYAPVERQLATGEPATCDNVNEVENPSQLLNECIPWAEEATCEDIEDISSFESVGCDF